MRKIIHIDADAFYASVEVRENPALAGRPVAVGGSPEGRGVVAAASYEARKHGVRSAMPSARAVQQCPGLVLLPPRFDLYRAVSRQFHEIFREYTERIEPLSLDEAYLDVSGSQRHQGSATRIAEEIRARIREELRLTVSAGVAPNKFLAKVASDWKKPDGLFTLAPAQVADFVQALPVSKIMGVGKVTAQKMQRLGIATCGDLQRLPMDELIQRFGKYGQRLAELARGQDEREVNPSRIRKSISVEHTYPQDLAQEAAMQRALADILKELLARFRKIEADYLPSKRFVKLRFRDFTQSTLDEALPSPAEPWHQPEVFARLLQKCWQRKSLPIRLLGAGLRLEPRAPAPQKPQLPLFATPA